MNNEPLACPHDDFVIHPHNIVLEATCRKCAAIIRLDDALNAFRDRVEATLKRYEARLAGMASPIVLPEPVGAGSGGADDALRGRPRG